MARIKRTTVASGIIGEYGQEWSVIQQRDLKTGSECYELFINPMHIDTFDTVVDALSELVNQFQE